MVKVLAFPLDNVEYDASALGAWCGTRTRGVYSGDGHFAVTASSGMAIKVSPGLAWLKMGDYWGVCVHSEAEAALTLDIADGMMPRVDVVCLQLDKNSNQAQLVIKKGGYNPQPPVPASIVRDINYDEIYVATVQVRAGTVSILQTDITDQRLNETYCGLMRDGVTSIPTQSLYTSWQEWYTQLTQQAQAWYQQFQIDATTEKDTILKEKLDQIGEQLTQHVGSSLFAFTIESGHLQLYHSEGIDENMFFVENGHLIAELTEEGVSGGTITSHVLQLEDRVATIENSDTLKHSSEILD